MWQTNRTSRFASFSFRGFLSPLFIFTLIFSWFFADWSQNFNRLLEVKQARASDVVYIYDNLGRLKAVVDPATDTAVYEYDAVGNLLSISRHASSEVSIIEFTPESGPVGTTVTIYGTGFSTTTTDNAVDFNGTPATVTSATETEIVTAVPDGATTGPITVATPTGSATSTAIFTVTASTGAPTITSFTPTIGAPGTPVTISGTNFETIPPNNNVKFNIARSTVSSSTATAIDTTVPPGTGSGRISVTTPLGQAISTEDFFIPPPGFTAGDVEFTGRIAVGGASQTLTINTAGKIALIVFDGTAGQQLSLGLTGVTISQSDVFLHKPDGTILGSSTFVTTSGAAANFPLLPVTGTYTILVDPRTTRTGSMTLTLSEDITDTIVIDGSPLTVNITRPGQRAWIAFEGVAGQQLLNLGITGVTIFQSDVFVYNPDGSTLVPLNFVTTSGKAIDFPSLPVTGTYKILISPRNARTGSMTLTLSTDITGTIVIDGAPVTVDITKSGQDARLSFDGTAGQFLGLGITDVTMGSSFSGVFVSILKPDGTTLGSDNVGKTGGEIDVQLPVNGTYTVLVDPVLLTGSATLTLSEDIAGPIAIDGAPVTVTLRPGQNARLSFDGTTGQEVSLGATDVTIGSGCCSGSSVTIFNPDSTVLVSTLVFLAGRDIDFPTLPQTGSYTVLVDPSGKNSGSMTLTLSEDITGMIVIDGSSLTVDIARPGQEARITFEGTAGQNLGLGMSGVTIFRSDVFIFKPDGTTLGPSTFVTTSGASADIASLPVSGTYTIFIDPRDTHTGSMTLTLSEDITGAIVIDGSSLTVDITRPGQNARITFDGSAGQLLRLAMTGVTISRTDVFVLNPDGTTLTSTFVTPSAKTIDLPSLPVSGTYTILINPRDIRTGSMTLTLSTL